MKRKNVITLSKKTGISKTHLYDIENGKVEPGKRTAKKIASLIDRPWNEIIVMNGEEIINEMLRAIV